MHETLVIANGEAVVVSLPKPEPERENEDAVTARDLPGRANTESLAVLAVADGLGGHPQGARAAQLTIELLERKLEAWKSSDSPEKLRDVLLDTFEEANEEVIALGTGSATTLAVLEVSKETVRPYHAGDSMIMVVGQRGRQKLLTVPHSPVGYQVEGGLLSPEEALFHEDLSLVSNFLGSSEMRIELGATMPLAAKDTVVIGSDGLFDNLRAEEISELVRVGPLASAADKLIERCLARMQEKKEGHPSKPDDLSFVLYRRS